MHKTIVIIVAVGLLLASTPKTQGIPIPGFDDALRNVGGFIGSLVGQTAGFEYLLPNGNSLSDINAKQGQAFNAGAAAAAGAGGGGAATDAPAAAAAGGGGDATTAAAAAK